LPDTPAAFEDFQWIRTEIVDGGGDASICRADFVDGLTSDQLRHVFRTARNADYSEITAAARELWASAKKRDLDSGGRGEDELVRLRKRVTTVAAIDYFNAPERAMAEEALAIAERELMPEPVEREAPRDVDPASYRGRTWVTRADVFVDRMASAWLIRRFIDPDARFKFVRDADYKAVKGEIRFDMFEAEFTHEGDRCTFETLLNRFELTDPSLKTLGEIVHDIDLKDARFARDDAPGIERVLAGVVAANKDDSARLERGYQLFDELHALWH
jgi:hypothetical protein